MAFPLLSLINQNVSMAQDLMGRRDGFPGQILPNPQNNSFPIPPRMQDGYLQPPPNSHGKNFSNNQNFSLQDGLMPTPSDGNNRFNSINNLNNRNDQGRMRQGMGILGNGQRIDDSPRSMHRQDGILGSPNITDRNSIQNRVQDEKVSWNQSKNIPSLMEQVSLDKNRSYQNNTRTQNNSPKSRSSSGSRNMNRVGKNGSKQNRSSSNYTSPSDKSSLKDSKKPKEDDRAMRERALAADVSDEFFQKIKKTGKNQDVSQVCLEIARKEFLQSKGEDGLRHKPGGIGHHSCGICKINFLSEEKLNNHYNTLWHKELDELYCLKKEQAQLILENRISGPNASAPLYMIPIVEAEEEMKLKATSVDLDSYILGIYESVMRAYWPVPKSKFYCRICNYKEFRTSQDHEAHQKTREHKDRESTYKEAFCLYCQIHLIDAKKMSEHKQSIDHIKILDLMERTKQCAIEHWHKENNKDFPASYKLTDQATPLVGSKRQAPQDFSASSSKKSLTKDDFLDEKDQKWFVPLTGFVCTACQTFLPDSTDKEFHSKQTAHISNVNKMKKLLLS
ncbi:uncharacterized protein LOC100201447 isoform X2 [Hydra vulgaris]|uniref:Uncharacterized protein LOC100201447 isoform X2 n=1 Tax=Hydra vulgaris TaxID=6087 RepID=A0ABM4C2W3_HYDVU